ncbi:MAG: malonyl-ACP O-methyltransferase BioC [Steroidobacteraceae bacterium]
MNPSDPFALQRADVRSAFDRAGASYEAAALLQSSVGEELLARLEPFAFTPAVVLDLGAGTGRLSALLKRRYRKARVIALDLAPGMLREAARHQRVLRRFQCVCADAGRMPLRAGSVDVVFSNLMLQWCDPPDAALAEVRRVLRPQGFFAFSTFGPDTLRELREAWDEDGRTHVNRFLDMHDVGDALMRAGFAEPVLDVERMTVTYRDALSLMRDLQAIGARNITAGRARSLTGKGRLRRMEERYEAHRRDGKLPATYEVIYGAAWNGRLGSQWAGSQQPSAGAEVRIAPKQIGRRGRP